MHPPLHVASILFLCGGLFLKQAQQPTRLRVLFFYPKAPTVRYYNLNWDDHLLLGLGSIKVILKQIYWWGYCKNFPQPMNIFFLVSCITSSCEHYFQWTLGITHHRVWTIGRNTTVIVTVTAFACDNGTMSRCHGLTLFHHCNSWITTRMTVLQSFPPEICSLICQDSTLERLELNSSDSTAATGLPPGPRRHHTSHASGLRTIVHLCKLERISDAFWRLSSAST